MSDLTGAIRDRIMGIVGSGEGSTPKIIFLVVVAAITSYFNAFYVPFVFDDVPNIVRNQSIIDPHNLLGLRAFLSNNRWVGKLSFALNYHFNGIRVFGYHLVNTAIHAANGVLVFIFVSILARSTLIRGRYSRKQTIFTALATSLLFTVHPIQSEAVTYIVQRFTSLSALFYLLAVVLYVKYRTTVSLSGPGAERHSRRFWYLGSFAATLIAMKTRENCFTLPLILVLCEVLLLGWQKKSLLYLAPFCLTLPIIPATVFWYQPEILHLGTMMPDLGPPTAIAGAAAEAGINNGNILLPNPSIVYLITQCRVVITYLRLLLLPAHQNLDYDYPLYGSLAEPPVYLSIAALGLVSALVAIVFFRFRKRFPQVRLFCFGVSFFFVALLVESSVVPLADVIFEHRLYLPSVGAFMSGAVLAELVVQRFKPRIPWLPGITGVAFAVILVALTAATITRNGVWKTQVSLWQDVVKKSPGKARGFNNLALALMNDHQLSRAIEMFDAALAINPGSALSYNGRGVAWAKLNEPGKAYQDFIKAIELDPGGALSRVNMGYLCSLQGKDAEALDYYDQALRLDPHCHEAYNKRGVTLLRLGKEEAARSDFLRVVELDPLSFEAPNNLGLSFLRLNRLPEALAWFNRAITANAKYPEAYNNRGVVQAKMGRLDKALEDYSRAIKLNPRYFEAYCNRGSLYGDMGLSDKAFSDIGLSLSLKPDYGLAHYNKGRVHLQVHEKIKAEEDFDRACNYGLKEACPLGSGRPSYP